MEKKILVVGGAGYVGSVLVPKLIQKGYHVKVFDNFWFWKSPPEYVEKLGLKDNPYLITIKGDLRISEDVRKAVDGMDTVIQLACISNDPSSDLDPRFTDSINHEGNITIIDEAKKAGIKKFIYASSSSVYGIKEEPNVTEEMELEPLTQYSRLKIEIEKHLLNSLDDNFKGVIIRPSTVCGYSPRQRLDLVVNILTNFAVNKRKIKVFGGEQLRPNIHIDDMTDLYVKLVEEDVDKINGKIYNAGWDNLKVIEIAQLVRDVVGNVEVEIVPTDDNRSYHVSSEKIKNELGFVAKKTVKDAIFDLKEAFERGEIPDIDDIRYYNIKLVKKLLNIDDPASPPPVQIQQKSHQDHSQPPSLKSMTEEEPKEEPAIPTPDHPPQQEPEEKEQEQEEHTVFIEDKKKTFKEESIKEEPKESNKEKEVIAKKAVVTGGAGFIGSHMVELLLKEGFKVIAIDDFSNGQVDNVELFRGNSNYQFERIDISKEFDDNLFLDTDYVFHMAALADIVPSIEEPFAYHQANVTATVRVLEACRKHGIKKFVYSASSSCYGIPDTYPTLESAEIRPEYPYAFTKHIGEMYVLFWCKLYGIPAVSLRYFNVFGTRARTNNTYGAVFKVFLKQKLENKPLTIVGDGTQTRDFTYVTDITRANLMAAQSKIQGKAINIGTGQPQSVNYLARLIGGPTVKIPKRPGEPFSTHASTSKAKELLQWEPKVSFEDGVKVMLENIDYWKDAPLWDKDSINKVTESWFKYLKK